MLKAFSATSAIVLLTSVSPAIAQENAADVASEPITSASDPRENILTDIIVTASRRRNENVQQTPIAITALTDAALERNQVGGVADIARLAPNIVITRQLSTANQVNIFVRGFGNGSNDPAIDPPIALYVDGIYQPLGSGTQLDMFGVQELEIQRGPQGTLLGKNAPTGAISIVSRRPTSNFGGAFETSYERFDRKEIKGRLNVPIVDGLLAVNASVAYKQGGNYIRSLTTGGKLGGEKGIAARIGVLFTPSDRFEWLIQMNGENTDNPQTGMRSIAYLGRNGPFQGPAVACAVFNHCDVTVPGTTRAGYTRPNVSNDRQVSSQMLLRLDPITITSVTSYKTLDEINRSDVDGEAEPILDALEEPLHYKPFSQELRLASRNHGGLDLGGHLDWVVGAYYSNFKYDNSQLLRIFGSDLASNQKGRTKSYALFGHFVVKLNDKFNISVGGRQSWDKKTHRFQNVGDPTLVVDDPVSFSDFSMEAGAQYKFTADKMIYFRYAEGYRAGGYQGLPAGNLQIPYDPETVKTYEIGAKADFFNHRLRANVTLFQSDYKDLQRTNIRTLPPPVLFGQFIQNAANARVRGMELESTVVPMEGLTIGGSVGYLDPKYKNFRAAILPGLLPTTVISPSRLRQSGISGLLLHTASKLVDPVLSRSMPT